MLSIHEQGKFETWNKTNLVRVNPILDLYIGSYISDIRKILAKTDSYFIGENIEIYNLNFTFLI